MFKVTIVSPKQIVYQGEAHSVFFPGDSGEFEVLPYHAPVVSLLQEGKVIVDWEKTFLIKKGIVKFFNNDCVALIEERDGHA